MNKTATPYSEGDEALAGDMDRDEAKEVLFRQQEIDEALKMFPQLGDSVRSWLLFTVNRRCNNG